MAHHLEAHNNNGIVNASIISQLGPIAPPPSPAARPMSGELDESRPLGDVNEGSDRSNCKALSSDTSRVRRASLADELSSSLATIAGAARGGPCERGRGDRNQRESSSSSGDDVRHESSSSNQYRNETSGSGGLPVVTASTVNTSSGDDRYTSGANGSEENMSTAAPYAHAETVEDTGPLLRHYQRRRPASERSQARDGLGLPVPVDERLMQGRGHRCAHAVVVARLPPPQTDSTGSSSFFSSSSDKAGSGGSGGEERNDTHTLAPVNWRHHGHNIARLPTQSTMSLSDLPPNQQLRRNGPQRTIEGVRSTFEPAGVSSPNMLKPNQVPATQLAKKRAGMKRQRSMGNNSISSSSGDSACGTDGGYDGSASSNDNAPPQSSCSCPSDSSSEGDCVQSQSGSNRCGKSVSRNGSAGPSLSSVLNDTELSARASEASFAFQLASRSCSPVSSTFSSSSNGDGSSEEMDGIRSFTNARVTGTTAEVRKRPAKRHEEEFAEQMNSSSRLQRPDDCARTHRMQKKLKRTATAGNHNHGDLSFHLSAFKSKMDRANERVAQEPQQRGSSSKVSHRERPKASFKTIAPKTGRVQKKETAIDGLPPIFSLGYDTMAECLSYLEPTEVHTLLTSPLSKDWHATFTQPHDLWRILCLLEPFKAKFDNDDSSDESLVSFPVDSEVEMRHLFGRYRLLYTSFVRCMRYLARIKDDAVHGRPPSVIDYGGAGTSHHPFTSNSSLKAFLARAKGITIDSKGKRKGGSSVSSSGTSAPENKASGPHANLAEDMPVGVSDTDTSSARKKQRVPNKSRNKNKKPSNVKYGASVLTQRLLGPAKTGEAGNVNLPWSCAIFSIVNWMVAFSDVEGIQSMCLRVLPFLLEDENQRTTAQRAGLTGIVLRGMVLFPNSIELHTAAFHTIVLLARPLGGREGMLFHSSMVNSSGIFKEGSQSGKNGIAVMLDSMRRFSSEETLQAMSCWSLVNIALVPSQKAVLVKLGGVSATATAMMQHPYSAEVQFRALFALINLVIPSGTLENENAGSATSGDQLDQVNDNTEREMLNDNVGQITNLVVLAMKNFCSSQTILNRACLVLHNLSLTQEYHTNLLWTPNCYQMLEWCLANYRSDQVLQQSAAGTLHRLQLTLSNDDALRSQFTASIQAQQQLSLEQAHREATTLRDQQQQLDTEETKQD